jgi:allophanate hydrolase subunit 1
MDTPTPRLTKLGTSALLCEGAMPPSIDAQGRVWRLADAAAAWTGVCETVPGVNNVLIIFDPLQLQLNALTSRVLDNWRAEIGHASPQRLVSMPVVYGDAHAEDLRDVA